MTVIFRVPVFGWWCATEELRPEIAAEIAKDKEDRQPCEVPEGFVDPEYAEIE